MSSLSLSRKPAIFSLAAASSLLSDYSISASGCLTPSRTIVTDLPDQLEENRGTADSTERPPVKDDPELKLDRSAVRPFDPKVPGTSTSDKPKEEEEKEEDQPEWETIFPEGDENALTKQLEAFAEHFDPLVPLLLETPWSPKTHLDVSNTVDDILFKVLLHVRPMDDEFDWAELAEDIRRGNIIEFPRGFTVLSTL
ncbi:hypothetical protein FOPE_12301 [Fonsecaea pedrosoi]|nr:hypothetical protein FOPE_12301 [Fonsecaea pedrosoi]